MQIFEAAALRELPVPEDLLGNTLLGVLAVLALRYAVRPQFLFGVIPA